MKYINIDSEGKVNNQEPFHAGGTSLQGYVDVSYDKLVKTFGEPNAQGDGYKTDAEWIVFTPAGVSTIYNYKDGHNYNDGAGLDVESITDWHIGGKSKEVVEWIEKALNL